MGHSYDFKIALNHPNRQFRPGEAVTGNVVLKVEKSMTVKEIYVELSGELESCNYKYMHQYNYTTKRHESRRISNTIKYDLFRYGVKVFPPPNIQQFGSAGDYTLAEGSYTYPFELEFPEGPVEARTYSQFEVGNSYMSTPLMFIPPQLASGSSGSTLMSLPPSFSMYTDDDNHAYVNYVVEATVDRKGFLKSDFGCRKALNFAPHLEQVMFSLGPLMDRNSFMNNFGMGNSTLRIEISKNKRREGKSFFKKVFSSRHLKVPFELVVEFKQSNAVQYPRGQTCRVLHQNDNLADVVNLRLYTPFSKDALQQILIGEVTKKGESANSLCNVVIKELAVSLAQDIRYQGVEEQRCRRDVRVGTKSYKHEFDFSDFEQVEYWGASLYQNVKQEHASFAESGKAYMLEIPPEMLSMPLNSVVQSFTAPNISCDVYLKLSMVLATTEETQNRTRIFLDTPIAFLPSRNANYTSMTVEPPAGPPPNTSSVPPSQPAGLAPAYDKDLCSDTLPSYTDVKQAS
ncbi:hypothetical protein CJJ07_005068 [Candidozyma auris]|nr:hypothetical protein CJJ07_005068 [[Candida] auris]